MTKQQTFNDAYCYSNTIIPLPTGCFTLIGLDYVFECRIKDKMTSLNAEIMSKLL